jgi:hypothetical protein
MLTRMIMIGKCVWLAVFPSSSRELNLLLLSEFSSPSRVKGLGCLEKLSEEPREHFPELAIATVEDRQDRKRETTKCNVAFGNAVQAVDSTRHPTVSIT